MPTTFNLDNPDPATNGIDLVRGSGNLVKAIAKEGMSSFSPNPVNKDLQFFTNQNVHHLLCNAMIL